MTSPALALDFEPVLHFELPETLKATRPPEERGVERDAVRLMVASGGEFRHRTFGELPDELDPGDLVVVNNSRTLPASVVVDDALVVHFSTRQPGGLVVVEPRLLAGDSSERRFDMPERRILLPGGGLLELLAPFPLGSAAGRLWLSSVEPGTSLDEYLMVWGRPIRYSYVDAPYPLDAYQTVFATVSGSAEMPSAGRPFTGQTVADLVRKGVVVAPITLHTGVSSLESGEAPYPEWYRVSETTAALINHTKSRGGKVVAVGTTVVRALESAVDTSGEVHPSKGWTDLVIGQDHEMSVVDALVTGWHEPDSTHLDMLDSLAGHRLVASAYSEAIRSGYMWHEFGDSLLLIPDRDRGLRIARSSR